MAVTNEKILKFNLERDRVFLIVNMAWKPFLAMSEVLDKHFLSLTENIGSTVLIVVVPVAAFASLPPSGEHSVSASPVWNGDVYQKASQMGILQW